MTRDDEPTYVELPPGVGAAAGTCALLKRHVRDATRRRWMTKRVFRDIAWTGVCSGVGVGVRVQAQRATASLLGTRRRFYRVGTMLIARLVRG